MVDGYGCMRAVGSDVDGVTDALALTLALALWSGLWSALGHWLPETDTKSFKQFSQHCLHRGLMCRR